MKAIYAFCLLVFLAQKPSLLYLIRPFEYRFMLILVSVFCVGDYIVRGRLGRRRLEFSDPGVAQTGAFVGLTALLLVLSTLLHGEIHVAAAARLLLSLVQFFFIYNLVVAVGDVPTLLKWLNRLAVALSVGATWLYVARMNGWLPDPVVVDVFGVEYNYFFPWGFLPPEPVTHFRTYSYFLEPGKFAAFLTPVLVYTVITAARRRSAALAACSVLHAFALWTTASVAAFGALAVTAVGGAVVQLFLRRRLGPALLLAGAVAAVVVAQPQSRISVDQDWVDRRGGSWDNRSAQFKFAAQQLVTNPLGAGWKEEQATVAYQNRMFGRAIETGLTGFILMFIQSFGLPGLMVLAVYLWYLGGAILKSIAVAAAGPLAFDLAHMAGCVLLFNMSIDMLASPMSMLIISCMLLHSPAPAPKPEAGLRPALA